MWYNGRVIKQCLPRARWPDSRAAKRFQVSHALRQYNKMKDKNAEQA
jgi:hypothetical protein